MCCRDEDRGQDRGQRRREESGFILIALFGTVMPLMLVLAAASMAVGGGNSRLLDEVRQEKALIAAESGIDEAIYRASTSLGLTDGQVFQRELSPGLSFSVATVHLLVDGVDNDFDGDTDEADEDVFRVLVKGTYRDTVRRIVTYLGPAASASVVPLNSALQVMNPGKSITVSNSGIITGYNTNVDGTRGSVADDLSGIAMAPPGTLADLAGVISGSEAPQVTGLGADPSLALAPVATDVNAIKLAVQNSANVILTSNEYESFSFGDASVGDYNVIYRDGNLTLKGGSRGAGIMVVTGDFMTEGNIRFDGIIIVLGHVEMHGTSDIYGGLITGPNSEHLTLEGNANIVFSAEAVAGASKLLTTTKYVQFNGWQELSRK